MSACSVKGMNTHGKGSDASAVDTFQTYWIMLCVDLYETLVRPPGEEDEDLPHAIAGYFLNLGVTALSEATARDMAASEISDGSISWEESQSSSVSVAELPLAILQRASDWTVPGIWYRSGRAFFPPD